MARKFNVSRATIRMALHGKHFKYLKRYAELPQKEAVEVEDKKPLR